MKALTNAVGLLITGVIITAVAGCAAFMMVNERALTLDDIITMSKAKVGDDVIKTHIDVTHSKYNLTPADVVRLKNEGVADEVIEYMLETDFTPDYYRWEYGYAPYYYGYNYYNRYYYPYSNYYNYYGAPHYYSPFWGGYRRPYWNPYTVNRSPGMVGRFYYYQPLAPFFGEDLYSLDRHRQRRDLEEHEWKNRLQRRDRDKREGRTEEP